MNTTLMFSSKTDLWSTPPEFYKQLNDLYNFTLDPSATKENAKCKKFFTIKENGLLQSWKNERVFCNPPYGREIGLWVEKARFSEAEITVMLLPARTDTRWFHDNIYGYSDIEFLKGRLKFGNQKNPAPFPSMLVIFRK